MSETPTSRPGSIPWTTLWNWGQKFASTLTVIGIAIFGFWGGHFLLPGGEGEGEIEYVEEVASRDSSIIKVSRAKLAASGLKTQLVAVSAFRATRSVPGSLDFDQTHTVKVSRDE